MRTDRWWQALLAAVLAVACCPGAPEARCADWNLSWSDEFDGDGIDKAKWDFDLGNGFYNYEANAWISGWGNGELQYYTREPENAFVNEGMLHLRAVKESYQGCGYTSARTEKGTGVFCATFHLPARCVGDPPLEPQGDR
jgi:beta-glucanase (GH16 family)